MAKKEATKTTSKLVKEKAQKKTTAKNVVNKTIENNKPAAKSKPKTTTTKSKVSPASVSAKKNTTAKTLEKKSKTKKEVETKKKTSATKKTAIPKKDSTLATKKTIKAKEEKASELKTKRKYVKKEDKKENKPIEIVSKQIEVVIAPDKPRPVKSILISLPKPEIGKSPYIDIANQFKIKLDWRPFTEVQPIKLIEFRLQKIYIEQFRNIIFTSKTSIEQYFRILNESRLKINEDNKYFCINEAIALYLQKFINYRKRKVFFGDGKLPKLMEVILKNRDKNGDSVHLIPSSETKDKALSDTLKKYNIVYKEAVIYKTVPSNLSDLKNVKYDMLVFFNSMAIDSLYSNFPDFVQDKTRLAIYGNTTAESVMKHKLRIDVFAPTPTTPSLADAIKKYITAGNKK